MAQRALPLNARAKLLNPKSDVAFKHLFGRKNQELLVDFIKGALPTRNPSDITYLQTAQDPELASKKQSILDVLCKDKDGSQYIVEMQLANHKGFEKRAQYYAAKAYSGQAEVGDEYHGLKEIIFIAITDFVMFPNKQNFYSTHVILDCETMEHDLKDFSFTFIELPKFQKKISQLEGSLDRWAFFFKEIRTLEAREVEMLCRVEPMDKAYQALAGFGMTAEEFMAYEAEQKRVMDNNAVEMQLIDDAEAKKASDVASKMLGRNYDIEDIVECTGLTRFRVEELKNELEAAK